ncbi:D-alanyl-D-alanine carboxypeptidase [Jiella sp. MQZ9-1]|uniref:D-alanyl-D-alanine carboxypeptidase n=1 Tax=Jiella flava TaxID=2816857 RepID=A0A939FXT9_9HYPH|nr:D-alanyl-D-alanine carboxypeptidase family protein [Jiella flava]MBO0663462.1 D-alanyl-D-alanine carboxypeptidase [Jiella flava]MCD2472037.1 D-alanyl-D-alanine carboxypeptidase [Jiella flava]
MALVELPGLQLRIKAVGAALGIALASALPAGAAAPVGKDVPVPAPKPEALSAQQPSKPADAAGKSDAPAATDGTPAPAASPFEHPSPYPVSSIVVDLATGKVLSHENATVRRYPASTTKLMTAYVALEQLRAGKVGLDSPVIVTNLAAAQAPSKMGYPAGSVIRLDNALHMMLVKSANDIAMAIGQMLAGGSEEDFVAMMDDAAARLGMKDSHFINPNGLPGDGQYVSAKDMALLAMAIRRDFPAFASYFGTPAITNGRALIKNGNKLLGHFDGADGMKTGYICAAGFNLVSSATRKGRTLIAVVLGANGTIARERLSAKLLEEGFKTDPTKINLTVTAMPISAGPALDVSDYICSAKGRSARASDRVAVRNTEKNSDRFFDSPYMIKSTTAPPALKVSLGGAAGNDKVAAGVSIIESYGIPLPTPRPDLEPAPQPTPAIGEGEPAPALSDTPTAAPPAPKTLDAETSPPPAAFSPAAPSPVTATPAANAPPQPDFSPDEEDEDTGPAPAAPVAPHPPMQTPSAPPAPVNAFSEPKKGASIHFPLGVESPLATKGPRLHIGAFHRQNAQSTRPGDGENQSVN